MHHKTLSPWMSVTVTDVKPGAVYDDVVYDQNVIVLLDRGLSIDLFDMAPMIASGVRPGDRLEIITAVSIPVNLQCGTANHNDNSAIIRATSLEHSWDQSVAFREELVTRRWCILESPTGHFLMTLAEIVSACSRQVDRGETIAWDGARLDLMAWKRQA